MNLQSLSIFVGTAKCNAKCPHCAGVVHRPYAPKKDGEIDSELIYKTLKECYHRGARSLSISSSGEPTLSPESVTKTFELITLAREENIVYSPINLYSNGIRIGEDKDFCEKYLGLWKDQGLTTVYVTVHDIDEKKNAKLYGIEKYPDLELIISRIHDAGLLMRANLVLSKNNIGDHKKFISMIEKLKKLNVDFISAWPIRGLDDQIDHKFSPLEEELDKMEEWIENNYDPECKIRLLREKNRVLYATGKKLTLFPDGTLSGTWCN